MTQRHDLVRESMMDASFLTRLFSTPVDAHRYSVSLSRLASHLAEPPIVTGRVAVAWYMHSSALEFRRKPLNDLDFLVPGIGAVAPTITEDFLVAHCHPSRPRGKLLLQLADKELRTRLDLFTPKTDAVLRRVVSVSTPTAELRLVSPEDLVCHSLALVAQALRGEAIDPKYWENTLSLQRICAPEAIATAWPEYRADCDPGSPLETLQAVGAAITDNAALLRESVYSRDVGQTCPHCAALACFPLAPRSDLLDMWGYV